MVFRGCSSPESPEKCAPQRKSSGVFCVTYCAALLQADSGRIHLQRPHVLTLAGVVCRRPWSGLPVVGESTAMHNHLLRCLSDLHAAVGPRNLVHKLTRSAAGELVSNNTHLHTHTHVLLWYLLFVLPCFFHVSTSSNYIYMIYILKYSLIQNNINNIYLQKI